MGNAIKYLKNQIMQTPSSLDSEQVCATLLLLAKSIPNILFGLNNRQNALFVFGNQNIL